MKKKLTVLLTALTALAGVSYAFADGVLNDAAYTREHGGVGNFLFRYGKGADQPKTADNVTTQPAQTVTQPADTTTYQTADTTPARNEPTVTTDTNDQIDLGASSAGRAH